MLVPNLKEKTIPMQEIQHVQLPTMSPNVFFKISDLEWRQWIAT
jgi:hypothetical protein